ncbi:hypothetical protein SNOG_16240 [Parastagonospora nodorum SN15]|uniref:Uncharacterized protein n=1 Tax=Phaeosphaeria nodorum (strain SN15 / ATCC MYA-4574 / FGSC 10173) TaxID=321614 RepID=Q0TWB6_PHANO|nr:hypothetical protein SNOG_16240 [Parastagonospora nodorum SN15]EAT76424.1 hypothetical protein SNOG_16240 [Parastagonospora nodorum SN15]
MHHITMDQIIMYLVDALDQLKAYATTASSTLGWIVFILGFWAWSTSPRLFWNTMRFLCDTLTIMLRRAFIGIRRATLRSTSVVLDRYFSSEFNYDSKDPDIHQASSQGEGRRNGKRGGDDRGAVI